MPSTHQSRQFNDVTLITYDGTTYLTFSKQICYMNCVANITIVKHQRVHRGCESPVTHTSHLDPAADPDDSTDSPGTTYFRDKMVEEIQGNGLRANAQDSLPLFPTIARWISYTPIPKRPVEKLSTTPGRPWMQHVLPCTISGSILFVNVFTKII